MSVITVPVVELEYDAFKGSAALLKARLNAVITRLEGSTVSSELMLSTYVKLGIARDQFTEYMLVPGMVAHAQAAEDDVLYNVATETTALVAAIQDAIDWVDANFPSSAGYLLDAAAADGVITYRTLPTTAADAFSVKLAAVVALVA